MKEAVSSIILWAGDKNTFGNKRLIHPGEISINVRKITESFKASKHLFISEMAKTIKEKGDANWEKYYNKYKAPCSFEFGAFSFVKK